MDIQIGVVTHFYDKINVAVVEVMNQSLKVGDRIKISGHDNEFDQVVESLQMEFAQVTEVPAGDSCGITVDQKVFPGDILYLRTAQT